MADFIAYIDEAGDEGFGKLKVADGNGGQSRWLLIGACLVQAEDDAKLPVWRDGILKRLPGKRRDLHFRDLNHDQKVFVSQEIGKLPVGAAVTFSHKVTLPGSKWEQTFRRKGYLYNYLIRWLLERLTTDCRPLPGDGPNRLKLVFSRRGGTDYATMRDYLILMRDGRELMQPVRSICWDVLDVDNIAVETHRKWAGLQVADCITSAFFAAVEPNVYGNFEPRYADQLRARMIRKGNNALNCGIAPVPSVMGCKPTDHHKEFFLSFRG
jgi:hypothetical protein